MRRDSGTFAARHKVSVVIGECFGRPGGTHAVIGPQAEPCGNVKSLYTARSSPQTRSGVPLLWGAVAPFPAGSPVYWDRTNENQRHPDFGFHVWQEVGNPPRSIGVPINKRRMTGFKITVKPEGRPR